MLQGYILSMSTVFLHLSLKKFQVAVFLVAYKGSVIAQSLYKRLERYMPRNLGTMSLLFQSSTIKSYSYNDGSMLSFPTFDRCTAESSETSDGSG